MGEHFTRERMEVEGGFEYPSLFILEQTPAGCEECLNPPEEEIGSAHTVVKNTAFDIHIGASTLAPSSSTTAPSPALDLNAFSFDAKLLYHTAERKEVDYVASKPFEILRVVRPHEETVQLQCEVKVLSSHYEGLCFVLYIFAVNPARPSEPLHPQLSVTSHPIRVVSKPENKSRKRQRAPPAPRKKKEDRMKEAIQGIAMQLYAQEQVVHQLTSCLSSSSSASSASTTTPLSLPPASIPLDTDLEMETDLTGSTPPNDTGTGEGDGDGEDSTGVDWLGRGSNSSLFSFPSFSFQSSVSSPNPFAVESTPLRHPSTSSPSRTRDVEPSTSSPASAS